MSTELLNSYVHKTVEHRRKAARLTLRTSQSLFSSSSIDVGTNLLLRVITAQAGREFDTCLDLGCGYGPLGLSLASSGIAKNVELVDRDALAIDFTALNAVENQLANTEAYSSLGLDDARRSNYDAIVSNLPGKAGSGVLQHMLAAASSRLEKDGQFWGVVVNPLWPEIKGYIEQFGAVVVHVESGPRHTAFGFRNESPAPAPADVDSLAQIYARDRVKFVVGGRTYSVETSRGVHEFNDLSYQTKLLLEQLYELRRDRSSEAVSFNVSQGYVPLALRASRMAGSVQLVDRDLLALRTSARNLRLNGLDEPANTLHHQVSWLPEGSSQFELVVGMLRGDEPTESVEVGMDSIADGLRPGGTAVIAGGSTPITRVLKSLGSRKDIRLLNRSRYRGSSVVTLRKTD